MIGPENLHHSLNQSDAKLKPIITWSPAFSRPIDSLVFLTLSSHWLLNIFSVSTTFSTNFGFVSRHSIKKHSIIINVKLNKLEIISNQVKEKVNKFQENPLFSLCFTNATSLLFNPSVESILLYKGNLLLLYLGGPQFYYWSSSQSLASATVTKAWKESNFSKYMIG